MTPDPVCTEIVFPLGSLFIGLAIGGLMALALDRRRRREEKGK